MCFITRHVPISIFSLSMAIIIQIRTHTIAVISILDWLSGVCHAVILSTNHSFIYSIRRTRSNVPICSIRRSAMNAIMRSRTRIMMLHCI